MLQAGCGGGNRQHMLSLLIATMVIAYIMGGMLGVFTRGFCSKNTDRPRREYCCRSHRTCQSAGSVLRDGLDM